MLYLLETNQSTSFIGIILNQIDNAIISELKEII